MAIETCPACGTVLPADFPQTAATDGVADSHIGPFAPADEERLVYPCPTCKRELTRDEAGVLIVTPET